MSLKKAYLYLVSIISLVIMVIGGIMLLDMALKTWVFTKADRDFYTAPCYAEKRVDASVPAQCTEEEEAKQKQREEDIRAAQKQRSASQAIAMLLVASPIWYFHWRLARK